MFGLFRKPGKEIMTGENFSIETANHRLQYQAGGETLIVAFDDAARSVETPFIGRPTWGQKFYRSEGHSLLGVIARSNDWFRCAEVIRELETLSRSGFFGKFRKVVMTGCSMGGFAAGAFAPLAPNCTVIAMSPQATRDPRLVPWESRFPNGKVQNWNLPYGNAFAGIRSAGLAYVFFDSLNRQDLKHARILAAAAPVVLMPVPAGGHGVPPMLSQLGKLGDVTRAAIDGTLSRETFLRDMRERKQTARYYRILAREALYRGRNGAAIQVCDAGIRVSATTRPYAARLDAWS
ncbi:hypothetical protein GL279_13240 [Paracoccus limosus]|uniref:Alpha/beta hydrolase n=1 Tax=Paracoccus limosus TaxID=913252 RepID=A0A844H3Y8_9RHOB|nr:hypothetical protein [Paracoccus limosus]MTH35566.1 hypothetical protein [Paracoccus limosus]